LESVAQNLQHLIENEPWDPGMKFSTFKVRINTEHLQTSHLTLLQLIIYWATTYTPTTKGNVALSDTTRKLDVKFKKKRKTKVLMSHQKF
jgi:hypothetical protein